MKHNSKLKTIHSQKKLICWRKRKSTKGIEKTSGHFNTKVFFLFEKVEKHETGDAKGDTKKKREDTKQFEPDGKWNKKNMCSKKYNQEEREKHKENKVKKEKRRRTNEEKCKEEDQKPEQMSKKLFLQKKKKERKKKRRITK